MNARSVGVVLALVGLTLVAHPLYLFPHHGETSYYLSNVETVGEQPSAETVAYEDLPPVAQDRFDAELDGFTEGIWTGEHAAAYEAFSDHEYVEYEGEYYEYRLRSADNFGAGLLGIVRMLLSTLAVVALVVGVFVAHTGRFRPLTPFRALWIPVGVFAALVATEVYDVALSGAHEPASYVHLQAMVAAFVATSVVGSAFKRRGWIRVPARVLAAGVLALIATAVFGPTNGDLAVGALVLLAVTGPWFVLGYGLTATAEPA